MKKEYILALVAILLIPTTFLFADNTVGGSDQPWGNDDDDSTATVVPVCNTKTQQTPVIYDLNGRCISSPQKGKVYIVNGKKKVWRD